MTRRIGEWLRMVERCSIDRTYLIKYDWLQLHVKVYELMKNKDRYLDITF